MKPSTSARTREPRCWRSTRRKCRSALPARSRDLSRFSNPQSSAPTNNAGYTKNWRRRWRPFTERKKLGHFPHRCGFAAHLVPDPKTIIGGEPLRGVFHLVRQFAGARKGRGGLRRVMSLAPDQRIG